MREGMGQTGHRPLTDIEKVWSVGYEYTQLVFCFDYNAYTLFQRSEKGAWHSPNSYQPYGPMSYFTYITRQHLPRDDAPYPVPGNVN